MVPGRLLVMPIMLTPPLLAATAPAWWTVWELDLPAIAALAGIGALYLRGEVLRRARSGQPRPGRVAAFGAGWVVALSSLVSPVAGLAGELLWVHMVQHLLLVVVAAPLLALGAPQATVRRALGPGTRHALARSTRRLSLRRRSWAPPPVVVATGAHVASLWLWHAPPLYDLAATNAAVHLLEHAFFLGTAVWFWTAVVGATRRREHALASLCLGVQIAQGGVLGALLTFPPRSLFDSYAGARGLTALEDQQLAGTLMWVPPGFVYGIVAVALFIRWFDVVEREARRRETRRSNVGRPRPSPDSPTPPDPAPDGPAGATHTGPTREEILGEPGTSKAPRR